MNCFVFCSDGPQVSVSKTKFTVSEGSSLRVECLVDSNPTVQAVWKNSGIYTNSDIS